MKRVLSFVLALLLCVSAAPLSAFAAEMGVREEAGGNGLYRTLETPTQALIDAANDDGFAHVLGYYVEIVAAEMHGPGGVPVTALLEYPEGFDRSSYRVYRLTSTGTAEVYDKVNCGPAFELQELAADSATHFALAWNEDPNAGPGPGGSGPDLRFQEETVVSALADKQGSYANAVGYFYYLADNGHHSCKGWGTNQLDLPQGLGADTTDYKVWVQLTDGTAADVTANVKFSDKVEFDFREGQTGAALELDGGEGIHFAIFWNPVPAANSIKVAKAEYTLTASAKKNQTIQSLGAKAAGGTITYKSSSKQVTVTKAGKVTVKKGFVGKAVITIAAEGNNYKKATKKVSITVNPAAPKLTSLKNTAAKKVTVKWKKVAGVTGYQIQYSTSKKFTDKTTKSVTVKGAAKVSKALTKLTKGKTYYVRMRTYQKVSGKTYYSAWSAVKTVKIRK